MKNDFLIPELIKDITDKMTKEKNSNVRDQYYYRCEAILKYIEARMREYKEFKYKK